MANSVKRRSVDRRQLAAVVVGFLLLAVFVALLVIVPSAVVDPLSDRQFVEPDRQAEVDAVLDVERVRNELRVVLLQAVGGIIIVAGGVATWVNLTISRRREDLDRVGQIAEHFSRSVAQLDGAQEAVRIGAIYALERIAEDSDRDIEPVADVLCAIVRHRARRGTRKERSMSRFRLSGRRRPVVFLRHRIAEAQVALTVLGRLPREGAASDYDLFDTNLRRADLRNANLSHARLSGSILANAILFDALFVDAKMAGVDLSGAHARGANFRGSVLQGAILEKTDMRDAEMAGVDLSGAHARGADFRGSVLQSAIFEKTDMRDADLSDADLSDATMRDVRLDRAKYSMATTWPQQFDPVALGAVLTGTNQAFFGRPQLMHR